MAQESENVATILTVDDDKSVRDVVMAGLREAGYRCADAESPAQAATALREDGFDLVLLDINMPQKTGTEYLSELVLDHPDLAVVMLTGDADVDIAIRTMREGAYDYITKPVDLSQLTVRVQNALSRRSLLMEKREYQAKLEELVAKLKVTLDQRKREVSALNRLFQSHMNDTEAAQLAFDGLTDEMAVFSGELEGIAGVAGSSGGPDGAEQQDGLNRSS